MRAAGTNLNVTDRKRAEQAARLNEDLFQAVFDGALDLIFMKDRHLRYTHVNPAMARVFGLDASEIIGRTEEDVYGVRPGNISDK